MDRVSDRKFVVIEQDGVGIVGVSGTFDHGKDGEFREAGATRITLNGFNFQRVLHYARSLHEFILDYSYTGYFSTVVDSNEGSINNLEAVGFERWSHPDPALVAAKAALSKPGRVVEYIHLTNEALVSHARELLEIEESPSLRRPNRSKPGEFETVDILLDLEILNEHHPVVEQIASGNLAIHD